MLDTDRIYQKRKEREINQGMCEISIIMGCTLLLRLTTNYLC